MTKLPIPQVLETARSMIICFHRNPRLMCGQESPVIKGKIEHALARLDRLDLGENDEDTTDAQESMRRENLFTSVASTPPE